MSDSLHLLPAHNPARGPLVPLPVTFYLTEEILEDESATPEHIAELLARDVAHAVEFYREKRREA